MLRYFEPPKNEERLVIRPKQALDILNINLLLHDGQIEESLQSQPNQEPNQEAIFQEAHQDERNGPQVLEEPEA